MGYLCLLEHWLSSEKDQIEIDTGGEDSHDTPKEVNSHISRRKRLRGIDPNVPDSNTEHDEEANHSISIENFEEWSTSRTRHDFGVLPGTQSCQEEDGAFESSGGEKDGWHEV